MTHTAVCLYQYRYFGEKAKKISPKSIQTIEQNGKTFYVGFDSDGNFFEVPKDNSSVNAEDNSTDYAQSQEAIEKAEEIDNISSHVQQLEAFNNLPEEQKAEVRSYFKQKYSDSPIYSLQPKLQVS